MALKLDRFTWSVIGIVVVLLVAAVITVNVTGGRGWGQAEYLDEDTPAATVHNAYVAFLKRDLGKARQYYTDRILAEVAGQEGKGGPFDPDRYFDDRSRRLRILDVKYPDNGHASVVVVLDHYYPGGLFDRGSTWSERRTIPMAQEDGHWKIDSQEFFY